MSNVPGTVVITGAAGGMGRPAAVRFAAQGRSLLLCDLNAERLETLAAELRGQGGTVTVMAADIAAAEFPAKVIAALDGAQISALIHTAGLSPTMADGERIFEVNYHASERLVAALLPHFAVGGCAVLISSVSAYLMSDPGMIGAVNAFVKTGDRTGIAAHFDNTGMAYTLSKRAVIALVGREAEAYGKRGARICSIAPGFIDTEMGRAEAKASEQMVAMIAMTPMGRLGDGDEIASVAEFLCSPAASYITGCDIRVDGGIIGHMGM